MPRRPRPLIDFIIDLGKSKKLRDEFDDDRKRDKLLEKRGLARQPALQPGATVEQVKAAVIAEDPAGVGEIEFWILVGQAPIPNT